jgi:hypothetical protein
MEEGDVGKREDIMAQTRMKISQGSQSGEWTGKGSVSGIASIIQLRIQ